MPRPKKKRFGTSDFLDLLPIITMTIASVVLLLYAYEQDKNKRMEREFYSKEIQTLLQENKNLKAEIEQLNKQEPKVRVLKPRNKWYGIPQRWKDKGYSN